MQEEQVVEQQQDTTPEATPEVVEGQSKEAAEPEGEKQPEQEAQDRDEQGRFKPKVQQRIDEITRARHEAEREAAYWRARAESAGNDGKAQLNSSETTPAKPTIDQYQDYADYVEALTDWKASQATRKAIAERDAEQAQKAEAKINEAKAQTWEQRQAQARSEMPDYDEVVGLSDLRIAPHVADVLMDSEAGPALAYHFAKHPDIAERINGLSPLAAAREIGRLEASMSAVAKPAPVSKPVSKAPEPIKPIGSGSGGLSDPAAMSMDQYVAFRKTQGATWAR